MRVPHIQPLAIVDVAYGDGSQSLYTLIDIGVVNIARWPHYLAQQYGVDLFQPRQTLNLWPSQSLSVYEKSY